MNATGPKGQKRPADVIGNAVKVMRIATGYLRLGNAVFFCSSLSHL
jgi:hypothetical protein